jgi:hypothetical protein
VNGEFPLKGVWYSRYSESQLDLLGDTRTAPSWIALLHIDNREFRDANPTRASLGPDQIEEYSFVVVPQVGQVVGEVGEVIADAGLQVVADVTIDRG